MKRVIYMLAIVGVVAQGNISQAHADEMPDLKAGLWEAKVEVDGASQGTIKQCVDESTAKKMLSAGQQMMGGACSEVEIERDGDSYQSSIECNFGPSKMTSRTTLKGDFSSAYTTNTTTSFNPPLMGQRGSTSSSTNTYVGSCPDDMRPGDTIMADGRKVNMFDAMKNMPKREEIERMQKQLGSQVDLEELQRQMPNIEELQRAISPGK